MTTDLNDRVARLEFRADAADKQLEILHTTGDALKKALEAVQATLLQLKWLGYGAALMFIVSQFGILKAIKFALGIPG